MEAQTRTSVPFYGDNADFAAGSEALASERVILSSPMSYHGSVARIVRWAEGNNHLAGWKKGLVVTLTVLGILVAIVGVTCWYATFGLLVVPYRLFRRGQRKDKRAALQHREMVQAVDRRVSQ